MVVLASVGHTPDMSTLWSSMNIFQQHLSNKLLFRELSERVIIVIVTVMMPGHGYSGVETINSKPSGTFVRCRNHSQNTHPEWSWSVFFLSSCFSQSLHFLADFPMITPCFEFAFDPSIIFSILVTSSEQGSSTPPSVAFVI